MKEIRKLGLILFAICAVAAALLAMTNAVTAPKIAENAAKNEIEAKQIVLPDGKDFEDMDEAEMKTLFEKDGAENLKNVLSVSTATAEGNVVGYAIKVAVAGFGGDITMLVGIDNTGKLIGYNILSHSETAGLGVKIAVDPFYGQVTGKTAVSPLSIVKGEIKNETQVQAVTGATISSKAAALGINSAFDAYNALSSAQDSEVK